MLVRPVLGAIATLISLRVEMLVAGLFLIPALYLYSRKIEVKASVIEPVQGTV